MAHSDMVHTHVSGMAHVGMSGGSKRKIMIIIQMSGGLGNQMFQYALYLKLRSLGHEVKFDDRTEYDRPNVRSIQLSAFGIRYPEATKDDINRLTDGSMNMKDRVRRCFTGRKTTEYRENGTNYDEGVFEHDPSYLVGNFQSERYFADITDQVRKSFIFDQSIITEEIHEWEEQITHEDAISIHVRRGDYLDAADVYGGICTDAYYDAAIRYMQHKYPDAEFYLFTNDPEWSKLFIDQHSYAKINAVKCSEEYTGYLDMYLMTKCRHHIIANSSFSWWGAWLEKDVDESSHRDVISPKNWLNNGKCADIHTDDMILIDRDGKVDDESYLM